jgi:hypothetical protein
MRLLFLILIDFLEVIKEVYVFRISTKGFDSGIINIVNSAYEGKQILRFQFFGLRRIFNEKENISSFDSLKYNRQTIEE